MSSEAMKPTATSIPKTLEEFQLALDAVWVGGQAFGKALATTQPAEPVQYPLPDDLYDSKDWRDADYAGRVEWLHTMYESTKKTLDDYTAAPVQEPEVWSISPPVRGEDGRAYAYTNETDWAMSLRDKGFEVRPLVYADDIPPAAPIVAPQLVQEPDYSICPTCGGMASDPIVPPAQKQWVGLTDEEIKEDEWHLSAGREYEAWTGQERLVVDGVSDFARAIEAKLREKNGGAWVGLTDGDYMALSKEVAVNKYQCRAIEAKLREKNGGA